MPLAANTKVLKLSASSQATYSLRGTFERIKEQKKKKEREQRRMRNWDVRDDE